MQYGPIVISVNGYTLNQEIDAPLLQHPLVGGVILFANNHKNTEQLTQLISDIKSTTPHKDLMIMVDHEGGYVQRFRTGFTAAPAAKVLGDIYDINPDTALIYANQLGETVGQELKNVGVDIILGPVVDLDIGNAVISGLDRAYHADPQIITQIAGAYIQGLEQSNIHATLKHFPGHGADIGDSHITNPVDNRTWETLSTQDLTPFKNLIEADHNLAVMPAHIIYSDVDPINTAGTSQIWLQDILREELNFEGVIISDCLSMTGAGSGSNVDKILKALEYGDLALLSQQTPKEYLNILDVLDQQHFEWSELSQQRVQQWLAPFTSDIHQPPEIVLATVLPQPPVDTILI